MKKICKQSSKGYHLIKDDLDNDNDLKVDEKQIYHICRSLDIKSTIKYKNNGCTRQAVKPQHIADNLQNNQFHYTRPDENCVTDVTVFKWHERLTIQGDGVLYLAFIITATRENVAMLLCSGSTGQSAWTMVFARYSLR